MLQKLPTELIHEIFDACGDRQTPVNLSRCSRKFWDVLTPRIYRHNVRSEGCSAARWAVLHCGKQDVALRIIEASVYAGMDVWTSQFDITANDIFGKYITRLPSSLRTSTLRLSLFALSVLKRKKKIVVSLLDTQSGPAPFQERLLASGLTKYLKRLIKDESIRKIQATPLHVASAYGLNVVVKRILKDTPAAVEATDLHGRTPLCYAIRCPLAAVSTVRLLLRHQAKANDYILLNGLEVSLLEYCCKRRLFSFAVCLLEHGARGDLQHLFRLTLLASSTTRPQSADRKRATTLIGRLIQLGANPNGVVRAARFGERPLLLDLALASPSATERLLALPDVDVNIQHSSGWTTLSRLLLQNYPNCETVALLLRRGAKLQPYSFDRILRLLTFWSLQELITILSRYANTVNLFRLLYHHCESHTAKDAAMECFLASAAPQSRVLARISDSDLSDIRRGNVSLLMDYFDFRLILLNPTS